MTIRRRLTFQLTPLLDLLLIVIFAQFMDVRDTSEKELAAVDRVREQYERKLRELEQDLADLKTLRALDRRNRADEKRELADLRRAAERLRDQLDRERAASGEDLKRALKQRDVVGKLMAELFKVPDELIEKRLKPLTKDDAQRTAEEIARLKQRFRALSASRDREIVEHILKYEELRKWCAIWEVHIGTDGFATVKMLGKTEKQLVRDASLPLPKPEEFPEDAKKTAEKFQKRLFEMYKKHRQALPQAKSVVIIFVTYGSDTPYLYRKPAIAAIHEVCERMRTDAGGRPRFEYAVLGMMGAEPKAHSTKRSAG